MKILILVRILWPGGVQRTAFAEADGLRKLGNEVELVFIRDTGRLHYSENVSYSTIFNNEVNKRFVAKILRRITAHYLPARGPDSTVDIDLIYKFIHSIKQKYDLVYCFDEFIGFFAKPIKRRFGSTIVVLIHEAALNKRGISALIQRRAMKLADVVLTNSKYNFEILKSFDRKKIYEVYPGLYPKSKVKDFTERKNIAISVTMWDSGRKPEIFLCIAQHLNNGKIMLVGDWADENYLRQFKERIVKLNLLDRLIVTGPVSEETLASYYEHSKVSIRFGYDEKGPGMGSLESLSYGLPIIINYGIGFKEVIKHGINGFIVNERECKDVATLIDELFTNKEKWEYIHKNNLSLANEYSWDHHNEKLNAIFEKSVNNSKKI
ncbi:MAG: glycosyltransferase family 4 protein [Candidatus Micrarchaeaceae archaeon]